MGDEQRLRGMLDAAVRAGDAQADQLIHKENQLRDLRRAMHKTLALLRAGRVNVARTTLEQALRNNPRP